MFHHSLGPSREGLSLAVIAASLLTLLLSQSIGAQGAPVASIKIVGTNGLLVRGKSLQLIALVVDSAGRVLNDRTVVWSSNDPEIASVTTGGVVTAIRAGATWINASSEGVVESKQLTVRTAVASLSIVPSSATLQVGQTIQLLVRYFDELGHEISLPIIAPPITWRNNTGAVIVTSTGLVQTYAARTTVVTGTIDGKSASTVITVQTGPVASAIQIATRGLNAGTSVERDECVTIAAGEDASYECGDLRIVHPLPATTTMGRLRSPTLMYNSRQATAAANVSADVTYAGTAVPTELVATLRIVNRPDYVQRFPWQSACAAQKCRVVIPVADAALATGVYPYTLDVRAVSAAGTLASSASLVDTLVIVNRSRSPFGAGWWLDGLEQLVWVADGAVLWVGGDGSTRLFVRAGNSDSYVVASPVDRPETLDYLPASGRWRRWLRNRAYVEFDGAGRHVATVNRAGQVTSFEYLASVASTPLRAITLPVRSTSVSRTYLFDYDYSPSGDPMLGAVTSPGQLGATRRTAITHDPAGSLAIVGITDPDGNSVTFGASDGRISWRQNRLRDQTSYEYDAGGALSKVSFDMLRTRRSRAAISTSFCAAESYSRNTCRSSVAFSATAVTVMNGPRPFDLHGDDTTRFFVDRFGAPARIHNAFGQETILERSDARWPTAVTQVMDPRGHVVRAAYDEKGRVLHTVDVNPDSASAMAPNAYDTTTYVWDDNWDFVRTARRPSGVTTTASFDPESGDRLWQRPGDDPARNVTFRYDGFHQVTDVVTPLATASTHYEYDDFGNVKQSVTPLGFRSYFFRDALGRDSVIQTPIDNAQTLWRTQRFSYDSAGRLRLTTDEGPATGVIGAEAQAMNVRREYDAEGNLIALTRWAAPDPTLVGVVSTSFTYDELGRKLTETDPYDLTGAVARWAYDNAGNVIQATTKRSQVVTMLYDHLARLRRRTIPGVLNRVTGQTIDDVQHFGYDEAGNLVVATNSYAEIGRGFTLNGKLAYDTLRIRAADLAAPGMRHEYVLTNGYDADGRRSWQELPRSIAAAGLSIHYGYDEVTGDLGWVEDAGNNRYTYRYHNAGLLERLLMPGGVTESHEYDADGRERYRIEQGTNLGSASVLHEDTFGRDARGKITSVDYLGALGLRSQAKYGFAALGATLQAWTDGLDLDELRFTVDAFGSVRTKRVSGNERDPGTKIFTSSYEPHSNRLARIDGALFRDATDQLTQLHDADGNLVSAVYRQTTVPLAPGQVDAAWNANYGYAADGKLMVAERTTVNDGIYWIVDYRTPAARALGHGVYEEYRYDALGRRVWKRAHRRPPWSPYCAANDANINSECLSTVSIAVWDGDQILYELRAPGETTLSSYAVEQNLDCPACAGNPPEHFGTVFYLHGAEIDRPLELVKDGRTAVLHTTWRGQVDRTTDLNGALSTCSWPANTPGCISVDWPGLETNYFNARPASRYQYGPKSWYGDLVQNNEDASHQQYMRNRYYDANTGRFTQEDPIGIAGGMNLYGFAGGDHVNYSDPFGLAPCSLWPWSSRRCTWKDFKENVALFWHRLRTEPEQREMGLRGAAMMFSAGDAGLMMGPAPGYTVVIGKTTTLSGRGVVMAGQRTLVPQLAGDLGTDAANWARNERVLLQEMAAGNPIRDASVNPVTGALIEDTGFLARERNVLRDHGWTYNPRTRLWNAPR